MFEEDLEVVYESGPEEDDIIPAGQQQQLNGVNSFRVTLVFFYGSPIPDIIQFTDQYDQFLTALSVRYPARSALQASTQELIQQYNQVNALQGLRIFCPRFLTREQLLEFIGSQNRAGILQRYDEGIRNEIIMSGLAPDAQAYIQYLQQHYEQRNPRAQQLVVPQAPPPKLTKKISKRRRNSVYLDNQLQQVVAVRDTLLAHGYKPTAKLICQATGVKPSSVYSILRKDRLNQAQRHEREDKYSTAQVPQNIKEEFVRYSLLPENSTVPLNERTIQFNDRFNVDFHYKVYLNILQENNFTYRRLKITNAVSNQGTNQLQRVYMAALMSHVVGQPHMDILAFDESGFSLSIKPSRAWGLKGTGAVMVPGIPKSKNLTYIACISLCYGLISHQIVDQSMTAAVFFNFLQKSIQEYRFHDHHQRVLILMDNVILHLKKEMIADLASFECDFLYNASYTPRFNPIEELFGTIKGQLSFAQIKNNNQLKHFILNTTANINIATIRKYYIHSYVEMMNCILQVQ